MMPRAPLVSVIINNHNYGAFVEQALKSALAQTHAPMETIVVDDGSTDGSRAVLAAYRGRTQIVLQENQGQAAAVSRGFQSSRGDVVIFLDADDVLLPDAAEEAVAALSDPLAVKVHWPLRQIREDGSETGALTPGVELSSGDLRETCLRAGPLALGNAPTSGNAWRRSFLEKVLPVPECGDRHGADAYLCTVAPVHGRIARISQPLGLYRSHGGNYSGSSRLRKLRRDLRRYPYLCDQLALHFRRTGTDVDPQVWQGPGSLYSWLQETEGIYQEIDAAIPPGRTFILADGGQIGDALFGDRRALPFLERDGHYAGPPRDDQEAIDELERQRRNGADAIVWIHTHLWLLHSLPRFESHLNTGYTKEQTPHLTVFHLDQRPVYA